MMFSLALQLSFEKNMNQHAGNNTKGSNMKRSSTVATYHHRRGFAPVGSVGIRKGNISRSESDLAWQRLPKASVSQQTLLVNKSNRRKQTTPSQQIRRTTSQVQPLHTVDGKSPTRTHTVFVCGSGDVSKTSSKPPEQKSKGGSGWVESMTAVFYDDDRSYISLNTSFFHALAVLFISATVDLLKSRWWRLWSIFPEGRAHSSTAAPPTFSTALSWMTRPKRRWFVLLCINSTSFIYLHHDSQHSGVYTHTGVCWIWLFIWNSH